MKRLYYLVPELNSVESISRDLHENGVTDWRFHVISKDDAGLYTRKLHSASILQRSELVRFVERGALIGFAATALVLIVTHLIGVASLGTGWWILLLILGPGFGAWVGGFGGISTENHNIRKYHDDIEQGQHLILVDVPRNSEQEMIRLMEKNHPEARLQGESSNHANPFTQQ